MALWSGKAFHNFSMQRLPFLYFGPSPLGGRGVFTARDITSGALIEICPVLVLPAEELAVIHGTRLHDYYFLWGEDQQQCAIALGFGSLYNHASDPNAETVIDYEKETIDIYGLREIPAGEEITISYNRGAEEEFPLWF